MLDELGLFRHDRRCRRGDGTCRAVGKNRGLQCRLLLQTLPDSNVLRVFKLLLLLLLALLLSSEDVCRHKLDEFLVEDLEDLAPEHVEL